MVKMSLGSVDGCEKDSEKLNADFTSRDGREISQVDFWVGLWEEEMQGEVREMKTQRK